MSTRCLLSAAMRGKVYTIYCHHDGYPEHIIPLLKDHYNTQENIEALIMMGDTSAIYETLEKCAPYTKRGESYEQNAPVIRDAFELNPEYYDEYFWDGRQWFYSERQKPLKPISEYREVEDEEEEDNNAD